MNFSEDFLHFIWQFKLFGAKSLITTDGLPIEILNQGLSNKNAGPDFTNAKLKIGDTKWVGNVEVHLKSSDWMVHRHHHDEAYENVILHVVDENDKAIFRRDGTPIPTLVLRGLFDPELLDKYQQLIESANNFPCEKQIHTVDEFVVHHFLSRVLVERLEEKTTEVLDKLMVLKNDWDETFYHFIAKSFGFKVNAFPMQMLAQSLPQHLFAKHKDNPLQIEALLFGQAGFLSQTFEEDYPKKLKAEYLFLKQKYNLVPLELSIWKFLRMRPQNFPTLRLAQFAALVVNSNHLFSKILTIKEVKKIRNLFENLPVNEFWLNHYHFNKKADKVNVQLGKKSIDVIIINTISVSLFAYGKGLNQPNFINRALLFLEALPSENNSTVQQFIDAGLKINTAFYSQSLLQLKKNYCNQKKCLNCGVGIKILKQ